jgi:hypothetical protein
MDNIIDIKNNIKKSITIDDVIGSIIYKYLLSSNNSTIPSREILHIIFSKLKNNPKYTELFKDIIFDNSGIIPFSDELDEVLFRMEISNLIHFIF